MEFVAARAASPWWRRLDWGGRDALAVWVLAAGLVLYLGVDGGGYDTVVHSQVGVVVWWIVLIGVAAGLLPAARLTRSAWGAVGLLAAFVGWTALATTWSASSERSLEALSLVAGYLGVLVLAIATHRDREQAIRHTIAAVATAIVVVAGLALVSRLRPDVFPAARQTGNFLGGTQTRLGWPLNYWNALAALIALGLPLLLALATSARTLIGQAAAAGAIPLLAMAGYLTFSRGGAIAGAAAVAAFLALAPNRIPKLTTVAVTAAGSAALIAGAVHQRSVEDALANAAARHEGNTLILAVVLVCLGVGVVQSGIGLAVRHGTAPRWLEVAPRYARLLLAATFVVVVVVSAVVGPRLVSHAWRDFKRTSTPTLNQRSLGRFSTASGNGRYQLWKVGVDAVDGHALAGRGPGTFQLTWLPRAPYYSYVQNAHSLYVETLSEVGVVGLALLCAFFATVLGAGARLVLRTRYEQRTQSAGLTAALVAFLVAAASDWIWQVPAIPIAFLVLSAAVLAPARRPATEVAGARPRWPVRAVAVVLAIACLAAIAVPLATTSAIRRSQAAVTRGDPAQALASARQAVRLEPGAARAQIQLALVLELQGDRASALAAARKATTDEPQNWSAWLIDSRLEAETGHSAAALDAYRRARSLNPRSPLFHA